MKYVAGCAAIVALLGLTACERKPGSENPSVSESKQGPPALSIFLEKYWVRPVPPQGPPPGGWPPITTDLSPEACAVCHAVQYRDWATSLHAAAYSPGLEAQLMAWFETSPATVESCMTCHGPLSEQLRQLAAATGEYRPNGDYDAALERGGVVCAACHIREWRRHGPPRRDGSLAPAPAGTPHEGAIRHLEFEESRFCAACHQFEEPAPNGKPLENTLREWEASGFAERGVTCQSCHMPDRRHLWRGIHDPEMVRSGVTPDWSVEGDPQRPGFEVRLALTNTGTGHHFPTYVTPAVDLEIAFVSAAGDTLAMRSRTLRRDAVFDGTGWIEREDGRIPAGESRSVAWTGPAPPGAARVAGRVRVRPDAFYTDFFRDLLAETPAGDPARPLLEEALARTHETPFDLWTWERSL